MIEAFLEEAKDDLIREELACLRRGLHLRRGEPGKLRTEVALERAGGGGGAGGRVAVLAGAGRKGAVAGGRGRDAGRVRRGGEAGPAARASLASGEPRLISSRTRSPAEMCGTPMIFDRRLRGRAGRGSEAPAR